VAGADRNTEKLADNNRPRISMAGYWRRMFVWLLKLLKRQGIYRCLNQEKEQKQLIKVTFMEGERSALDMHRWYSVLIL